MSRRLLLLAPLPLALLVAAACGGDDSAPPATAAPSDDGGSDVAVVGNDTGPIEIPDAAVVSCKLDNGTDPVSLCVQKVVLQAEHAVFDPTKGVPSLWDVTTGKPVTSNGAALHDVSDDLAYAGMIAQYLASAQEYGDTEITPALTSDMAALASLLATELATLPAGYDGTGYLRLRRFTGALRTMNFVPEAVKLDAIGDAWGAAIDASFVPLSSAPPDGGADAGDDGGSPDDASVADAAPVDAGDAGAKDAGDAAVPPAPLGDGILGTKVGSDVHYDVAQAAMGALALVDLSGRAAAGLVGQGNGDAGPAPDPTAALKYARAAGAVLQHLDRRARDATGLYFSKLVVSGDVDHDAVDGSTAFSTDVQATVALASLRAGGAVTHFAIAQLAGEPLADRGIALIHALPTFTPSLWDTNPTAATTAACNSTSPPIANCGGGFFAGVSGPGGDLDTHKTVRSNAFLYGALHRANLAGASTENADLLPMRGLFTNRAGVNDAFLTVTFDQTSFIPEATSGFTLDVDAGAAASSYSAAANADALEGMNDQWVGVQGAPAAFY